MVGFASKLTGFLDGAKLMGVQMDVRMLAADRDSIYAQYELSLIHI